MKRSNKIHNADLFTQAATEQCQKHIRTQSKQTLTIINEKISWSVLLRPSEHRLAKEKALLSNAGRKP